MTRALKVFGGNLDGRYRVIAACNSKAVFCKLTEITRDFCSETRNADECRIALAEPGVVFASKSMISSDAYTRLGIPTDRSSVFTMVHEAFKKKVTA